MLLALNVLTRKLLQRVEEVFTLSTLRVKASLSVYWTVLVDHCLPRVTRHTKRGAGVLAETQARRRRHPGRASDEWSGDVIEHPLRRATCARTITMRGRRPDKTYVTALNARSPPRERQEERRK